MLLVLNRMIKTELYDSDRKLLVEINRIFYDTQLRKEIDSILEVYSIARKKHKKMTLEIPSQRLFFFATLIEISEFYSGKIIFSD